MENVFEQDLSAVASIKGIPTILNIICKMTGMRFAAVARVTEDRWVACSVHDEIDFGLKPGGELEVATTICHEIRQHGKAVIIDHVAQDTAYCEHHTPAQYGLQSYISMPIRLSDGMFFGTLCAIDPEPHSLKNRETVEMFEMFAEMIGFHLSGIRRVQSVETTLLDERKTSALREQFIAVLGHDMRNPLGAIDTSLLVLLRTPLTDIATTAVNMARRSVTRMANLIDDVTDFARGRLGGGIALHRTSDGPLEPVLRQVIAELQSSSEDGRIVTEISLVDEINCDRRRIGQLVSNLVGNALKYGAADEPVRVGASTRDGWLTLYVANAGDQIPEHVARNIFAPFSRGQAHSDQPHTDQQGLGLGLYICSSIAEAHGGTLTVDSSTRETRFTFRMPI